MQVATDAYRLDSDAVARFVADECIATPHGYTPRLHRHRGDHVTTDHHAAQVDRATRLGLRPTTVTVCPLSVLGRRCRTRYAEPCICQRHHRLLDHGRVWVDDRGRRVLTGEPYDPDPVEVVDLAADLAPLGLAVELVPWGEPRNLAPSPIWGRGRG